MKKKSYAKIIYVFLVAILVQTKSFAETDQETQIWSLNTYRAPIGEDQKWNLFFEVQPRFGVTDSNKSRLLMRPAVVFNLNDNESVWLGAFSSSNEDLETVETRLWQQYQRIDKTEKIIFINRTRLEQRFNELKDDSVGHRLRHMIRAQIPINEQKDWQVVVFDEIFIDLNETKLQPETGLNQNRFFIGLRKEFSPNFQMEFGYLNQLTAGSNGQNDLMNHIPFLTISYKFDGKK